MNHIEGKFKGVRNNNIYYQGWLPEGEATAVLLIVHGLGEHSGRYTNVVNHFVPLGYAVYGFDLLGHGKSEGMREGVERFSDYTETLAMVSKMAAGWQSGKPVFLVGHSVGGLIACDYLPERQAEFKGALISAPAIKPGESISPMMITLSSILGKIAPRMGLQALDASTISRDSQVVKAYAEDPLVFHGKTPARLASELLKTMLGLKAKLPKITLPIIVLQATDDKLVEPSGAQMLYDLVSSSDKTLKLYQGYYHEVFNEPGREVVLKDVEEWLTARL
jgi:acylglycerol lipase